MSAKVEYIALQRMRKPDEAHHRACTESGEQLSLSIRQIESESESDQEGDYRASLSYLLSSPIGATSQTMSLSPSPASCRSQKTLPDDCPLVPAVPLNW